MSKNCTLHIGDNGCASLSGVLTFESVPGLFRETEKLFRGKTPVSTIDLAEVSTADSAGLALLLEWLAIQRKAERQLVIRNAPSGLLSLAQLCEADDVVDITGRNPQP